MIKEVNQWPSFKELDQSNEQFSQQDGFVFAGRHLLFDCWDALNLDNVPVIEQALRDSVDALNSELIHIHLHSMLPNGRITGVALMPGAQIGVRTWPDKHYAALDLFINGTVNPTAVLSIFKHAFLTSKLSLSEHLRGRQFTDLTPDPGKS